MGYPQLIDKAPLAVPDSDWQVYYAFFARAGFTEAAIAEARLVNAQLVDLARLGQDLQHDL
jgi:hypothetical protein